LDGNLTISNNAQVSLSVGESSLQVMGCASLSGDLVLDITTTDEGSFTPISWECFDGQFSSVVIQDMEKKKECAKKNATISYGEAGLSVLVEPPPGCSKLGIILGSVFGGVAVIIILVVSLVYHFKIRPKQMSEIIDSLRIPERGNEMKETSK